MTNVLVLGSHGMLGSMVARVLETQPGLGVIRAARDPTTNEREFDVHRDAIGELLDDVGCEWIVNAIGVVKPRIDTDSAESVENAVAVNALFPHRLATEAARRRQRVIQIATDGVYAGTAAPYAESDAQDAVDVYGKTKSLGESPAPNVTHLRCSIIGPERPPAVSLLGWLLSAAPGAELAGYVGQRWNGVTTLHFAKLCATLVAGVKVPSPQHVVPTGTVTKAELLELALAAYGRDDVTVRPEEGPETADRTLTTQDPEANRRLWAAAGYDEPPTIEAMLAELAAYEAQVAA